MSQNSQTPWDPHWNRRSADITLFQSSLDDVVELVQASESCRVSKTIARSDGTVRYHVVLDVDAETAHAWETTR